MEESELEEWFNGQKEQLESQMLAGLAKDPERARANFDKRYRALIATLQTREAAIYEQRRRNAKLHAPLQHLAERIRIKRDEIKSWIKAHQFHYAKWRFERKFKKILKDKSDL